jgi:WD40 repeat protein
VLLWDVERSVVVARFEDAHSSPGIWSSGSQAFVTCFSPDSSVLATGGPVACVRLWSVPDLRPLRTLRGHNGDISALAFAPDGSFLASGSRDTTVVIWPLDGLRPDGE